jgi:hypothetical protein
MISVGLIVYPVASGLEKARELVAANEARPLVVSAKALVPDSGELPVNYEKDHGWHRMVIPKGSPGDRRLSSNS